MPEKQTVGSLRIVSFLGAPAPDPGPRELRPPVLSPRTRKARRPSRTRLGTPQTPFSQEDPDPGHDGDHLDYEANGEGAKVQTRVRSGDGPLSVRIRPSSLKRDCDRRATSTGE